MPSPPPDLVARIKGLVRPLFALAAAVFVILVVKDMASRVSGLSFELDTGWLVASLVPSALAVLLQYQAWWSLVESWTGRRMPRLLSLRVYVDGQIARYTPGKVGLPAVRVAGAEVVGVSAQVMISTLLSEVLAWTACGTLLGGALMLALGDESGANQRASPFFGGLGAVSACGLLLLVLVPNSVWPKVIVQAVGMERGRTLMPWRVPAWQTLHFIASATGGFCLVLALGGSVQQGIYLGAVVCVAIVAGFLALLAPAGVGVREAMIAVFAEPVLGTDHAIMLGVLSRAVTLSSELLLFFLFRSLTRKKRATQPVAPGARGADSAAPEE